MLSAMREISTAKLPFVLCSNNRRFMPLITSAHGKIDTSPALHSHKHPWKEALADFMYYVVKL